MIQRPIFLVGAERSGTTLLRLMLDNHPEIAFSKESEYIVDLISKKGEYPSLQDYYEYLEDDRIFQSKGFKVDKNLTYPELVNSFLEQKLLISQKKLIGATIHRHFDKILSIWENPLFIHIIRDPRDVARSNVGKGWAGNVYYGVDRWIEANQLWQKVKRKISSQQYIEISYEKLICEPEKTLTEICYFLGISYEPLMLSYDQNSSYSKPDPSLIQQWRKKLSEKEIQLIEAKLGDLLINNNYSYSGLKKIKISNLFKKKLALQNWWYKVMFRINRFGLSLFLAEFCPRKLNLKKWNKKHQMQMNKTITKLLK